ncbi:MAG: response regulator transcription factor [Gemmatimonadaceae bacterium]
MDVDRTPTASVVIIADDDDSQFIESLLRDEHTAISRQQWRSSPADSAAQWDRPDVVILDGSSPDEATRWMRYLRHRWPTVGIVVMNASDADVAGLLDAGADDAIVRGSTVLGARLHAITRRARAINAGTRIAVGDIVFDRESRRVWCAGQEVQMTPREFAMLDCMFWNAPRPVGPITLADFVWGDAEAALGARRSVVEVYIGYLRRKLAASRSVIIRTVRGKGYRFDPR